MAAPRTHHHGEPSARFDDGRPGGESFALADPVGTFEAHRLDQVVPVLEAAERAARAGSWVAGFVAYDAAPAFDPALCVRPPEPADPWSSLPLAWFGTWRRRVPIDPPPAGPRGPAPAWRLEVTAAEHAAAVAAVKDLIADGRTYQLNLTAQATARVDDAPALYGRMVAAQGAPYCSLISTGAHAVACASPELFFEVTDGRVVTRPMKGTARRGRWPDEDHRQAAWLSGSAKDRAENVMIVDLLRNDLGRVCATGTIEVGDLAVIERYPTVWQLTSTVSGTLRAGAGAADVFGALFPSGSVTGAPKRATMESIARLEPTRRKVYCGAVGLLAPAPARPGARFAVAIRTATVDLATGRATYGAGGGITWPSDAAAEWDELLAKTAILDHPLRPSALLETIRRHADGSMPDLGHHLRRLAESAAYFDLAYDAAAVARALAGLPPDPRPARIRLVLGAGGAVTASAGEAPPPTDRPVVLEMASTPIRRLDPWMSHKTEDRRRYQAHLRGTADDVVLWNEEGRATETTMANLVVMTGGRWWTPPVGDGLLPGVARAKLLAAGVISERRVGVDELASAEGLAVVNALRGWRPATLRG